MAALGSVRRLSSARRTGEFIERATADLEGLMGAGLRSLERAWTAVTGQDVPNIELSREEQDLARRVYVPVTDYATWHAALEKMKPVPGLHAMMRFEALNFADGRRSVLDVYEAVAAEALSAGEWYYGKVSLQDVRDVLEKATEAGAFTVKETK
jgi:hypothetical protein